MYTTNFSEGKSYISYTSNLANSHRMFQFWGQKNRVQQMNLYLKIPLYQCCLYLFNGNIFSRIIEYMNCLEMCIFAVNNFVTDIYSENIITIRYGYYTCYQIILIWFITEILTLMLNTNRSCTFYKVTPSVLLCIWNVLYIIPNKKVKHNKSNSDSHNQ